MCPELRSLVQARLDEKWSPEQISNILRLEFSDRPELHASHETIYRAFWSSRGFREEFGTGNHRK